MISSLFRSILDLAGYRHDPLQSKDRFLGLDDETIEQLRELRSSDAWESYVSAIDRYAKLRGEALLLSRDDATLHETRGVIIGLRSAVSLLDEAIRNDDNVRDRNARRADAVADEHDRRVLTLYGTPGFSRD